MTLFATSAEKTKKKNASPDKKSEANGNRHSARAFHGHKQNATQRHATALTHPHRNVYEATVTRVDKNKLALSLLAKG